VSLPDFAVEKAEMRIQLDAEGKIAKVDHEIVVNNGLPTLRGPLAAKLIEEGAFQHYLDHGAKSMLRNAKSIRFLADGYEPTC
jgi:hypothetical protein